jgi:hypothetical protein
MKTGKALVDYLQTELDKPRFECADDRAAGVDVRGGQEHDARLLHTAIERPARKPLQRPECVLMGVSVQGVVDDSVKRV